LSYVGARTGTEPQQSLAPANDRAVRWNGSSEPVRTRSPSAAAAL